MANETTLEERQVAALEQLTAKVEELTKVVGALCATIQNRWESLERKDSIGS
jgi:hypothetical protein